jgi:hypothetical protein
MKKSRDQVTRFKADIVGMVIWVALFLVAAFTTLKVEHKKADDAPSHSRDRAAGR